MRAAYSGVVLSKIRGGSLVASVVNRSFWGWTEGIQLVSQSLTMRPGREIVPVSGDRTVWDRKALRLGVGYPREP